MKKRLLFALLVFVLLTSLVACGSGDETADTTQTNADTSEATDIVTDTDDVTDNKTDGDEEVVTTTYNLTHYTKGVKVLGVRALKSDAQINCDWTGSGIEMKINHMGGDIVFTAKAVNGCQFKVYVDGVIKKNPTQYSTVTGEVTKITIKNVEAGEHMIKLINVTGHMLSRATLYNVTFKGTIIEDGVKDNDLYIEFVGDSISCGWGVIAPYDGTFGAQDGELAYPIKTAQALGADYSVLGLSGQGLMCYTQQIDEGYLLSSMLRDRTAEYDFERKADVVVINVGTNDYNYRNQLNISKADFRTAYKDFLNTVKEKNGADCKIVCVYNVMNDTFQNEIIGAVSELGGEESGIYTLMLDRSTNNKAGGHPSVEDNEKYTEVLTAFIKNILK